MPAGRPKKQRDPQASKMVKAMAQWGVPQESICAVLRDAGFESVNVNTLARLYRQELDEGYETGKSKLFETAFKLAVTGNVSMLTFLLKTRCGLRETNRVEVSSPDGTMSPKPAFDFGGMTPEEITNIARAAFTGE